MSALHTTRSGQGPVLLLVHGVGGSGAFWSDVVARMEDACTCVAVDLAGFGHSSPLQGPRTVARWAGSLLPLVDELGPEPVVAVGHSLGGMVVQELALAIPDRVGALALCNTIPGATDRVRQINGMLADVALRDGSAALAALMAPGLFGPEPQEGTGRARQRFLADCAASDPETLAGALRAIMTFDALPRLGQVTVPVLVVAGEHEGNVDDQRAMASALPRASLVVMEGTGHMAPAEAPSAFAGILRHFLKGAEQPGAAR